MSEEKKHPSYAYAERPCNGRVVCGGKCRLEAGHKGPCTCAGDVDKPGDCAGSAPTPSMRTT